MRDRAQALLQWTWLGGLVGAACGVASAAFLLLLERATHFRESHEAIVYTLPLAGLAIGLVYERWGKSIRGGNNLIIDTIHENAAAIPLRMGPMVFAGTILTHLFGGSAGREGTAVQMGASMADFIAQRLGVSKEMRPRLLAAGMAGGFGSVFGTPVAGAIFGLEVVRIGQIDYDALGPALVASVVGDFVTRHLGVVHTMYPTAEYVPLTPLVLAKLAAIGAAIAGAAMLFVELTHGLKHALDRRLKALPIRMAVGGAVVVIMWKAIGSSDYLGLGVPVIVRSFSDPALPAYAFAAKLVFTAVTLASGFLGGEVTPLFFVGATLGSVAARVLDLPIALGAGVGLAALFGAAANTPLALSIMAVELLGATVLPHVLIVAVIAYVLSGHRGIYPSQRIGRRKSGGPLLAPTMPLRDFREDAGPPPTAASVPVESKPEGS
jgi:H+/Cl- antiporter ClcA